MVKGGSSVHLRAEAMAGWSIPDHAGAFERRLRGGGRLLQRCSRARCDWEASVRGRLRGSGGRFSLSALRLHHRPGERRPDDGRLHRDSPSFENTGLRPSELGGIRPPRRPSRRITSTCTIRIVAATVLDRPERAGAVVASRWSTTSTSRSLLEAAPQPGLSHYSYGERATSSFRAPTSFYVRPGEQRTGAPTRRPGSRDLTRRLESRRTKQPSNAVARRVWRFTENHVYLSWTANSTTN